MNLLKRLPIQYKGELHDVRLVNFSVAKEEVLKMVPANIKVRDFNGRAMISMVDVKLKNMRAAAFPFMTFGYRHIAFRLLVDDSEYNGGMHKGIFFLKSFTNKPLISLGGKLMTDYKLEVADIHEYDNEVVIRQGDRIVNYCLDDNTPVVDISLKNTIGALDRAYSVPDENVRVTLIQREKWPLQCVNCNEFENTFFQTAKFEGAFRVPETIYYEWLPAKAIAS